MLARLYVLSCFTFTSLGFTAVEPSIGLHLSDDISLAISSLLGFVELCQASYVSKRFRRLADQAVKSLCCIQQNGRAYMNYGRVLDEFGMLIRDAEEIGCIAAVKTALKRSAHFTCIQSLLEARFGYCIKHSKWFPPKFYFYELSLNSIMEGRRFQPYHMLLTDRRVMALCGCSLFRDWPSPSILLCWMNQSFAK